MKANKTRSFAHAARFGVRRLDAAFISRMTTHSSVEIRRCRPLLGTFVEIQAAGINAADLEHGVYAAFVAIDQVQQLMSFHKPGSEVSRMNRDAFYKSTLVHPWTWRVLRSACEFSRNSDGTFDVTTGRQLVKWNYLPRFASHIGTGSWRDIVFEENRHVRFGRPLTIDLGGIAKGFAVDRAVDALKRHGVTAGIVNAGGDLRAFGSRSQLVHIRNPIEPTRLAGAVRLYERAMATSGIYFARRKHRGRCVSPLLDGRTGRAARELISVTVGAAECMTADALTKIVFALHQRAAPLLARYGANALLLERDGVPAWIFHPSCDTSFRS
jgi:FAD:protein FMN transferase